MYDLVLFDLDGTLIDTIDGLATSVNFALRHFDQKERATEEVLSFVGNGIRKLIERSVEAGTDIETTDKVFYAFKEHYESHCLEGLRAYEGIIELVEDLKAKNIPMAVVTNKHYVAAEKIIEHFFGDKIAVTVGAREDMPKKPDRTMVDLAFDKLKSMGYSWLKPVYIGDSEVDIETGRNSNMDTISVSWGFRTKECLIENGATEIVDNCKELIKVLEI